MLPERMPDSGVIRTVKERLVLEALKALGVVIVPRPFLISASNSGCFRKSTEENRESRIQGQSCERVVI